ncbi:hypothetical protein P775_00145 [Puniceibacterium antarcticum]|uniref:Uncharacterized protein n=1 Tax=Puniceibacterium antarcticum TaxID=1206336 RepID=A0A2G8RL66_9RHOB|nr:hypothetical protein P775_00145 [Puniceibacterium antarcticum]
MAGTFDVDLMSRWKLTDATESKGFLSADYSYAAGF